MHSFKVVRIFCSYNENDTLAVGVTNSLRRYRSLQFHCMVNAQVVLFCTFRTMCGANKLIILPPLRM
jgi:hypothetical protein